MVAYEPTASYVSVAWAHFVACRSAILTHRSAVQSATRSAIGSAIWSAIRAYLLLMSLQVIKDAYVNLT